MMVRAGELIFCATVIRMNRIALALLLTPHGRDL